MSIPFSPARSDSVPDAAESQVSVDEVAEIQESAGGDGAAHVIASKPGDGEDLESVGALADEGSSVEQIRDILFGRQMSAYEERFALLEKRIQEATEALRQEIKERLDSLDAFFKEEAAGLGRRITQERDVRSVAVDELVSSVRQHRDSLAHRIDGVEEAANEGAEALRSQVLDEAKRAQTALETRTDDLRKSLDENVSALGERKADRQTLSVLLADMAARLSDGDGSA